MIKDSHTIKLNRKIRNLRKILRKQSYRLLSYKIPKYFVLILSPQRSGSTLLLDSLRMHPSISMIPEAVIFELLNLRGRRYPADLKKTGLSIEVRYNKWEEIPLFSIDKNDGIFDTLTYKNPYAIEKIHPSFYKFESNTFLQNIDSLKSDIRYIYLVRDPRAAIKSFLQYKLRNPTWYPKISEDMVPEFYQNIYESIKTISRIKPGLTFEYNSLIKNFPNTLNSTFNYLWPNKNDYNEITINLIKKIIAATDKPKRGVTYFLGNENTSDIDFSMYINKHEQAFKNCTDIYLELISN